MNDGMFNLNQIISFTYAPFIAFREKLVKSSMNLLCLENTVIIIICK